MRFCINSGPLSFRRAADSYPLPSKGPGLIDSTEDALKGLQCMEL